MHLVYTGSTALLGDSKLHCVFMFGICCVIASKFPLLYRTTGRLVVTVFMRYELCYCSKSISLLYRTTGDLK